MGHRYAELAFTPGVQKIQGEQGSLDGYASMLEGENYNFLLSENEATFIASRDSFYMASVSETGWPYLQHRGGPTGFMKVLDKRTIGFGDYSGNRQYISTGNFASDNRVSLFFMDYPNRRRLKILGRVRVIGDDEHALMERLEDDDYRARIERGFIIEVDAFDWNCPQHITPRFSEADLQARLQPLHAKLQRQVTAGELALQSPGDAATRAVLGAGPVKTVISGIRQLTPRVRAYELRAIEGGELPPAEAGAHLQIPVRLANGDLLEQHYSIASNPGRRDIYEIAVLREDQGKGGSIAVHQSFNLGQQLHINPPVNFFKLHSESHPALLIAGGIGITPIKAMAQTLQCRGTPFHLHYAGRTRAEMAYRQRLELQLGANLSVWAADEAQRLDPDSLLADIDEHTHVYVCGPDRLLAGVQSAAHNLGLSRRRLHFEKFG